MSKRSLLIIDKHQFGQLTDTYKWCEYLRDDYDITIVTPRGKSLHCSMDRVRIVAVSGKNKLAFGIKYMLTCLLELLKTKGVIIVVYFEGCKLFKRLLPYKKMILDIRTLSVDSKTSVRVKYNEAIKATCLLYDHVTCITKGIASYLGLNDNKVSILPLGSDPLSSKAKSFSELKLLYMGTLTGRNIDQTIIGFNTFMKRHPEMVLSYDIAGTGWFNEEETLMKLIEDLRCNSTIKVHGRVSEERKEILFNECNIGISYVPQTDYYAYQPPTKTFEYILSGMICMATRTQANCEIINSKNGLLINDTSEDFCSGLEEIYNERHGYNSELIKDTLHDYLWSCIVEYRLKPILDRFGK